MIRVGARSSRGLGRMRRNVQFSGILWEIASKGGGWLSGRGSGGGCTGFQRGLVLAGLDARARVTFGKWIEGAGGICLINQTLVYDSRSSKGAAVQSGREEVKVPLLGGPHM